MAALAGREIQFEQEPWERKMPCADEEPRGRKERLLPAHLRLAAAAGLRLPGRCPRGS
jgi:hypothetical protein